MFRLKNSFFILSLLSLIIFRSQGQNIQLFQEDFETGGTSFAINASGVGSPSGQNQWMVNSEYNGFSIYPNTLSQDSTYSGTISFAPYSKYMHINDSVTASSSNVLNSNYDPTKQSDRFAYMKAGICTKGLSNVNFTFFYVSEGSATAYGEVYYSVDNGPWTQTGNSQYNNKHKWQYEVITDPAFDNVLNLRFGFHWVNDNGAAVNSEALGIDDINIVGYYDSIINPVTITIDTIFPDPVCQGTNLFIYYTLSDTLCDGIYGIELSDAAGSFNNATNLGVWTIYYPQTTGAIAVTIPSNTPVGSCYKVRINRISPPPAITGTASVCFAVVFCQNTISTLQPAVTMDTNAVCVGSAIDVPFY